VTGQIGNDELPVAEQRRQLAEVPGGAAVPVDEEERRALTAAKDADPSPAVLDDPLSEARQKVRRIRHRDRLFLSHYECDGDRRGRVKLPVLRHQELIF